MILRVLQAATAASVVLFPAVASAGISDFLITNSQGLVYQVDGDTLAATEVIQLQDAGSINEIMYIGDNQVMSNVFGRLSVTDLSTGVTDVVFNTNDYFGPGIHYANGLAMTQSGDIFVSMHSKGPDFSDQFGALINVENQTLTTLENFSQFEFYLDNHQIEENIFLGADWNNGRIDILNSNTGEILSETSFGFDPVSFFESNGVVYAVAKEGGLYSYDYATNSVDFMGDITGAGTSIIGATVPAPGSMVVLSSLVLGISRRNRVR